MVLVNAPSLARLIRILFFVALVKTAIILKVFNVLMCQRFLANNVLLLNGDVLPIPMVWAFVRAIIHQIKLNINVPRLQIAMVSAHV